MDSRQLLARASIKDFLPAILGAAYGWPVGKATQREIADFRHDSLESIAVLSGMANRNSEIDKDFVVALSDAFTHITQESLWPWYQDQLSRIARFVPVETFNSQDIISVAAPDFNESFEDSEPQFGALTAMKTSGQLRSFESICKISKQIWRTLGASLTGAVEDLVRKIYRLELQLAAESIQTISFDSSNAASDALSVTSLDVAMSYLESQTLRPKTLLLAPGKTASARTVIEAAGLGMDVVTLPTLPAGAWYLIPFAIIFYYNDRLANMMRYLYHEPNTSS